MHLERSSSPTHLSGSATDPAISMQASLLPSMSACSDSPLGMRHCRTPTFSCISRGCQRGSVRQQSWGRCLISRHELLLHSSACAALALNSSTSLSFQEHQAWKRTLHVILCCLTGMLGGMTAFKPRTLESSPNGAKSPLPAPSSCWSLSCTSIWFWHVSVLSKLFLSSRRSSCFPRPSKLLLSAAPTGLASTEPQSGA